MSLRELNDPEYLDALRAAVALPDVGAAAPDAAPDAARNATPDTAPGEQPPALTSDHPRPACTWTIWCLRRLPSRRSTVF